MTNEELFLVRRLFQDSLGVENIENQIFSNAKVYSDDFLITADKNANSRGAAIFCPPGPGDRDGARLLQACGAGRIHFLYIFQQDLTRAYDSKYVSDALGKVECVVFQGSWDQPTAALADIQLPAAVYAEKEGTFTNIQGRVQRFQAAVPPIGASLPDLDILSRLALELGVSLSGTNAAAVFGEIAQTYAAFAGMTWQSVGTTGQLLMPESGK
jgi:predicted molibdopterin-dependent oxidoreductase YjgC